MAGIINLTAKVKELKIQGDTSDISQIQWNLVDVGNRGVCELWSRVKWVEGWIRPQHS